MSLSPGLKPLVGKSVPVLLEREIKLFAAQA